ncbi:MAG: hypothetical protein ACOYLN_17040 [Blastocatellia bacterium]
MENAMPSSGRNPDPETQFAVHGALPEWVHPLYGTLPTVEINLDLNGQVISSGVPNAEQIVRRYHTNLWNSKRGFALTLYSRAVKDQKRRVRIVEEQCSRSLRRFRRISLAAWFLNWNPWALFKFLFALLAMLVFLTASVLGAYQLLINSSQFADSIQVCLVIASLVGAGSIGGKLILAQHQGEVVPKRASYILGGTTTGLCLIYCVLLSFASGGFIHEPMDIMSPVPAARHGLGPYLQWVQMWYELSGALAAFAYAEFVYVRHKSECTTPNPDSWMAEDHLHRNEVALATEQKALRDLPASRQRLIAERRAFVDAAVANYLIRAEAARKQRIGLEQKDGPAASASRPKTSIRNRVFDWIKNPFQN